MLKNIFTRCNKLLSSQICQHTINRDIYSKKPCNIKFIAKTYTSTTTNSSSTKNIDTIQEYREKERDFIVEVLLGRKPSTSKCTEINQVVSFEDMENIDTKNCSQDEYELLVKKIGGYYDPVQKALLTRKFMTESKNINSDYIKERREIVEKYQNPFVKAQLDPYEKKLNEETKEFYNEIVKGPGGHYRYFIGVTLLSQLFYLGLKYKDASKNTQAVVTQYQTVNRIKQGGSFDGLIDMHGKPVSSNDFIGKYPLIYFGFTECPDICPTEQKKMCNALEIIKKKNLEYYNLIVPIFITVDTRRDTPKKLQEYSKNFTPNIVWLTGTEENISKVAKKYRVHYTVPDDIEEDEQYNVDHSIFFYFMDRNNEFLDFYGQNSTSIEMAKSLIDRINTDMGNMDSEIV